jgi:threonine dehydratase
MNSRLPTLSEIESAAELVYKHMPPTPQYSWPLLDAVAETEVWVKHENHTPVGAFKIRGGIVYFDWLRRSGPRCAAWRARRAGIMGSRWGMARG